MTSTNRPTTENPMATTDSAAARFPANTEVTLTITGKVIGGSSLGGRLVVEYLAANGFPDRIAVDVNSATVTAEAAPPPSPAEVARRDTVHALIRDSHLA